ncbi:hypothetical protein Tco_0360431 [Tanacetum coccineum]
MTPYTAYPDIQGIIYQDDIDKNRLMRIDELHKFSDGTLNHVRTALNDIATGIQMEYLPKRRWTKQDKQRARVMINAIDKKLGDRRLMHSLENFVGGRPEAIGKDHMIYHMMSSSLTEHVEYDESNTYVLERFNTTAGNHVKEILLKLNLPNHRYKDGHGGTWFQLTHKFIAACSYSTDIYKDTMKAQVQVSRLPPL